MQRHDAAKRPAAALDDKPVKTCINVSANMVRRKTRLAHLLVLNIPGNGRHFEIYKTGLYMSCEGRGLNTPRLTRDRAPSGNSWVRRRVCS